MSQDQGSTTGYAHGRLKRRLPQITVASLGNTISGVTTPSEIVNTQIRLEGVSSLLNIQIAAGIVGQEGDEDFIYPAIPGTISVTPYVKWPNLSRIYLPPLSAVPLTLPNSFVMGSGFAGVQDAFGRTNGVCMGDAALIEVSVDPAQYILTDIRGFLTVLISAEYNGNWWDVQAIEALIGDVRASECTPYCLFTTEE